MRGGGVSLEAYHFFFSPHLSFLPFEIHSLSDFMEQIPVWCPPASLSLSHS